MYLSLLGYNDGMTKQFTQKLPTFITITNQITQVTYIHYNNRSNHTKVAYVHYNNQSNHTKVVYIHYNDQSNHIKVTYTHYKHGLYNLDDINIYHQPHGIFLTFGFLYSCNFLYITLQSWIHHRLKLQRYKPINSTQSRYSNIK